MTAGVRETAQAEAGLGGHARASPSSQKLFCHPQEAGPDGELKRRQALIGRTLQVRPEARRIHGGECDDVHDF